jgi:hypothetical protein
MKKLARTLFPWMFMPYLTKRIPVVIRLKKIEAGLFSIQFRDVSHQLDRLLKWSIFFIIIGEYYKYTLLYLFAVFIIVFTKSA